MKPRKTRGSKQNPLKSKIAKNLSKTLFQYIQGKRFSPSTLMDLIRLLDIAPAHQDLFETIVHDFVKEGKLRVENQKYSLPKSENLATGPISIHHKKGFGFVKNPSGPDIFIPKHAVSDAVDGDIVEVEVNPNISAKGPEGEVVAILKRSRTHLAGTVIGKEGSKYLAFSPLLGPDKRILVTSETDLKEGDRIICKVLHWDKRENLVDAGLDRLIGHISDPSIDIKAAIEEFELPDGFTKEALKEAKSFGKKVSEEEIADRIDLRKWECVTIDPKTARDFDDAITLTLDEKGHYHLGVHIADVAHYVKPGTHLDEEAFLRCNSTYFPGECVPMLPEALSNELCSLKPKVVRLTQSVFAEFDPHGTLVKWKIGRSAIQSAKRFTYEEAFEVLQGKKKSPHLPLLQRMVDLCYLLKQKRMERGSIDFSMPSNVIMVDKQGVPEGIVRVEYDITHQMIEEFMLKANEIVAIHLNNQGKTLIYRVHEEPNDESFEDFFAFARSFGFHLPPKPTHRDIQKLFQDAKDSPLLPQLSVGFIRSMRLAAYSPENIGHYGLALEHYCHFTSPIRRYTDLVIQRLLFDEMPSDSDVKEIAAACSEKERISFKAESSVTILKKLRLADAKYKENPEKIYPAVVTKVKPFAFFFEIPEFDLEGSFHVSEIGNDFYEYNPVRMSFRGKRSGKIFSTGQTIYVRLEHVDFLHRLAKWSLT